MASPQIENGHIDIANTIADKFCSYRLSGQEWQMVWVILRKTWGWLQNPKHKDGIKKKMDRIALSQFAELTGIDRRKCHVLLKKLVEKKVIKKTVTQKGDRIVITYGFQKNFDLWKVSPKKVTVIQKGLKVSPKKTPTKDNIQKIKETIKENLLGKFKIITPIPENYSIQPEHIKYAKTKSISEEIAGAEFERFKTHHEMKGTKFKNWYAAYQKWIQNGIKYKNIQIEKPKYWKAM